MACRQHLIPNISVFLRVYVVVPNLISNSAMFALRTTVMETFSVNLSHKATIHIKQMCKN